MFILILYMPDCKPSLDVLREIQAQSEAVEQSFRSVFRQQINADVSVFRDFSPEIHPTNVNPVGIPKGSGDPYSFCSFGSSLWCDAMAWYSFTSLGPRPV